MAEDEPPSESSGKEKSRTTASLATLVQVSALFTVFAALIYVLGIVALWMPIARAFTNDFSTALYAVSLMSRTVVAGQGVRSLLGPGLYVTLGFLLGYLLLALEVELYIRAFNRKPTGPLSSLLIYLPFYVLAFLVISGATPYIFPSPTGRIGAPGSENLVLALEIAAWALYFLGLVVLVVVYRVREGNWGFRMLGSDYEKGLVFSSTWWKKLLPYVPQLFLVVVLYSFPAAAAQDPPLPEIRVDGTSNTEGYLLVHSDGFWYLFDKEGDLLAIPDSEVKTVRIARNLPSL